MSSSFHASARCPWSLSSRSVDRSIDRSLKLICSLPRSFPRIRWRFLERQSSANSSPLRSDHSESHTRCRGAERRKDNTDFVRIAQGQFISVKSRTNAGYSGISFFYCNHTNLDLTLMFHSTKTKNVCNQVLFDIILQRTCLGNRRVFPRVSVQTSRPHFAHRVHRCYYANVFYLGRFLCHCYALLCFACLLVLIHDSSMSPVCGYSNQAAGSCYYNDRQGDPNQSGRLRRTNKVTRSSNNTTRSSNVRK